MAQNVSWKKLGQVNPKGDLYLLVVFDAIHTRRELEVESYGKALLTAPKEMLDDMEDVFNGDLPFDSVAKTDSFKNRWEGIKGAVLDVRKIGKTKPLGKIGLTKIVKTTEFGSNTGSGAGAKATEMFESATAWMTALAYKNKGIPSDYVLQADDFNQVKDIVDTTATMDASFKFLNNNADWMTSTIKTANILYEAKEFKNTAFHFYRGKQIVNLIEKHFKQINKDAGRPFSNINKWTPADMYMGVPNIDKTLITDAVNFPDINNRMEKLLKDKQLIGVSLKRITSTVGGISKKNFSDGPPKQQRKFTGVTAKSLFGSMDVYFTASPDKITIQFRATDTAGKTWQGEVLQGKEAKHGKIGGGVLDNVLRKVLGNSNGLFARAGYSKTSAVASAANNLDSKILTLAEANKDMFTDTEDITLVKISNMPPKWKFAKYLGLLLADIMRTANDTDANDIATKLYLYATSESDESAPYIKVS